MSEIDNPDPLNRPAGAVSLTKYRAHGGGMELFRAYVERRNADRQMNLDRKAEVTAAMTPEAGCGVSTDVWERAGAELVMIQILEELDPVVQGLLDFCENQPEGKTQLSELRLLLRIDKGHAPITNCETHTRWTIEQQWIDAYLRMHETGVFLSENRIAIEIARKTGVTSRTAKNHWDKKKVNEPKQAAWAQQIQDMAKIKAAMEKLSEDSEQRAAILLGSTDGDSTKPKKRTSSKSRKSDYRKNNL